MKTILENESDEDQVLTSSITYMKLIKFELNELALIFIDVEEFRKALRKR